MCCTSSVLPPHRWCWVCCCGPGSSHGWPSRACRRPRPPPCCRSHGHYRPSPSSTFGPAQLQGHWSLLFFGFTRCPDICPNTLGLLQAVSAALRQEDHPAADGLQVVFVSVDPRHDTPAALKSYVEYFDPAFLGVTGPEPELQKLTGGLYMPYTYVPVGQAGDYTVEHSGALVLLNPQAQAVAYFSPPLRAASIVDDLRRLLRG
jgi:protein SCO1